MAMLSHCRCKAAETIRKERVPQPRIRAETRGVRKKYSAVSGLPRRRFGEVRLRRGFVLGRRDLVWIDPHHEVVDVVVDLGEEMSRSRGNHDDVAGLELIRLAV